MKRNSRMNMRDRQKTGRLSGRLSAGSMAKIMARMARDGETEELAEVIAEIMEPELLPADELPEPAPETLIAGAVEEILDTEEVPAPEAPVEVAVPENHEITIDCGPEILDLLRQIVTLLSPAADTDLPENTPDACGPEKSSDEDPAEVAAEALAEAVTTAVEAAGTPLPDEDPVTALVAEVVEQAVNEEAPGLLLPENPLPDAEEEALSALLSEPEQDEDLPPEQTTDALRTAMVTFRPILKSMAPAARRKAVAKIAANLKARDKKLTARKAKDGRTPDNYTRLLGVSRSARSADPTGELGRRIMAARNPHYKTA